MIEFPSYLGPMAFGIKMGVILPGTDLLNEVYQSMEKCHRDGLLSEGDALCITESVVARAQENYVSVAEVSQEIKETLHLKDQDRVAVVFPIASRNRFSLLLKSIAEAVSQGEVVVQLSFPYDEVGNQVIPPDMAEDRQEEIIWEEELQGKDLKHPITQVDYISLYRQIIEEAGAKATIFLSNKAPHILDFSPQAIIVADVHTRKKTKEKLSAALNNCITLQEICAHGENSSEWGLLGSNLSSNDRIKLAPKNGKEFVEAVQKKIMEKLSIRVEVLIYGDGAYKDPSSGIYELADPQPVFASTDGLGVLREGIKYKFLADQYYHNGKSPQEIEEMLQEKKKEAVALNSIETEGTTPRPVEDILASLADLVSGSADEGTPLVLVKGFNKD